MVSSAVYRYFPSRDELLTALIIDAYQAVAEAAEQSESRVRRGDLAGRWLATARAMRRWALDQPQEYALIYGSPVPGYAAPADTISPAARIPLLLIRLCAAAVESGRPPSVDPRPMPRPVRADLKALRESLAPTVEEQQLAVALMALTQLVGSISFELFGHLHNTVHDYDAYFDYQMRGVGKQLGLG